MRIQIILALRALPSLYLTYSQYATLKPHASKPKNRVKIQNISFQNIQK